MLGHAGDASGGLYTKILTIILHQHGAGAASFSDKGQTVNILCLTSGNHPCLDSSGQAVCTQMCGHNRSSENYPDRQVAGYDPRVGT